MPFKFNPFTQRLEFYTASAGAAVGSKYVRTTRFAIINSGTSGTVTLPTDSEVVLDDFGGTTDAVAAQVIGGKPFLQSPKTSGGAIVATSFDSSGNWVLTGTPSAYPIAIVYRVRQRLVDFDSTSSDIWGLATVDVDVVSALGYTPENVANKVTNFNSPNNTDYATTLAIKSEINSSITVNPVYMLSGINSDVSGYESAPRLEDFTIGALASTSQTVTTSETLLEEFVTNLGFPNVNALPVGIVSAHFETQKTAGANNYYSYFKLFKRSAGGTETLLLTSDNSSESALNTVQQVDVSAFNPSVISLLTTDRIVMKVYARMVSSTATVTLRWDDNTDARLQLPGSSLSYVPENILNKSTSVSLGTSDTLYPTQKAAKTYIDTLVGAKVSKSGDTMTGILDFSTFESKWQGGTEYAGMGWNGTNNRYELSTGTGSVALATRTRLNSLYVTDDSIGGTTEDKAFLVEDSVTGSQFRYESGAVSILTGSAGGGMTLFAHDELNLSFNSTGGGVLTFNNTQHSVAQLVMNGNGEITFNSANSQGMTFNSQADMIFGFNSSSNFAQFGSMINLVGGSGALAQLRINAGIAPGSPVDGDIWFDGTDLFMQVGGTTKTFTLV